LQLSSRKTATSAPWANQPQPCRSQGPQAASQQHTGHTAAHGEPLHSLAAAQQAANQPQCCQQPHRQQHWCHSPTRQEGPGPSKELFCSPNA
jgi:hypothetical protein